jgi:hypothetical protein
MKKSILVFIAVLFCGFCTQVLAIDNSACYEANFSEIKELSEVPVQIKELILVGAGGIADTNSSFSSRDLNTSLTVPWIKFTVGAISLDCAIVITEHGISGRKYFWTFLKNAENWEFDKSIYTYNRNFIYNFDTPKSLADLLRNSEFIIGANYQRSWGRKASDYDNALKWLKLSADHGSSRAQYALGVMYIDDRRPRECSAEKDIDEAIKWFKLANTGKEKYQDALYILYLNKNALHVPEAFSLLMLAADSGSAIAQEKLGSLYANGKEIERNDYEAVRLFRLALPRSKGLVPYKLGLMFANGRGVVQSRIVALALFNFNSVEVTNKYLLQDAQELTKELMTVPEVLVSNILYNEMTQENVIDVIDRYMANPKMNENPNLRNIKRDCIVHMYGRGIDKKVYVPYGETFNRLTCMPKTIDELEIK